jgi:hypothetical protein
MAGFTNFRVPLIARRAITMLPALAILATDTNATSALVLSQVVLVSTTSGTRANGMPKDSYPKRVFGRCRLYTGGICQVGHARHQRRPSPPPSGQLVAAGGQVPLIGRIFPAPAAAKVPEVIFLFWVVKVLTTAGGEATSDYLKTYGNIKGGGVEVGLFVVGLVLQFSTRRYRAFA